MVQPLAANFLSLVRDHSWLKKASSRRLLHNEAKIAGQQCLQDFWRCAKGLLDKGSAPQVVSPSCSASDAHSYFTVAYKSTSHYFQIPDWIPVQPPPEPHSATEMSPVTEVELAHIIRKSRSSSCPSSFGRLSYQIFKLCPSLQRTLLDLFNRVLVEGEVSSS